MPSLPHSAGDSRILTNVQTIAYCTNNNRRTMEFLHNLKLGKYESLFGLPTPRPSAVTSFSWVHIVCTKYKRYDKYFFTSLCFLHQPEFVLNLFLFLAKSQPRFSYKIVLIKKRVYTDRTTNRSPVEWQILPAFVIIGLGFSVRTRVYNIILLCHPVVCSYMGVRLKKVSTHFFINIMLAEIFRKNNGRKQLG